MGRNGGECGERERSVEGWVGGSGWVRMEQREGGKGGD